MLVGSITGFSLFWKAKSRKNKSSWSAGIPNYVCV